MRKRRFMITVLCSLALAALLGWSIRKALFTASSSNTVWIRMEKLPAGWKLAESSGLMPLGFDEKFMKLIGAEVGLPLNAHEKMEKKEFCMPCRSRMAERFGGGN